MDCYHAEFYERINENTFDDYKKEIIDFGWRFMVEINMHTTVTEDQYEELQPYIIDGFISEIFKQSEWERRFHILERAKEIHAKNMCFVKSDEDFVRMKLTNSQDIFISKAYDHDELETLIIPTELFKNTNLAPMEIIVWELKQNWNKSYSVISKILNRHPNTINETFKRAVAKMELIK